MCAATPSARLLLAALLSASAMPRAARADLTGEVEGVRSLAMGRAHRALGSGNEALWLNPAGMALTKRYNIDLSYGYGGMDHVNHAHVSAVDSKSGPVAGGAAYTRDWGNPSGSNLALNRFHAGAAYALGDPLAVGVSAVNVRGCYRGDDGSRDVDAYNGTAGVSLALGHVLMLGAAYQNFLVTREPDLLPPTLGAGAALRLGTLSLAGEWSLDLRPASPRRHRVGAGVEYLLFEALALRAGVRRGHAAPAASGAATTYLSAGAGVVSASGALGLSAERSLQPQPSWQLVSSFQFFL